MLNVMHVMKKYHKVLANEDISFVIPSNVLWAF